MATKNKPTILSIKSPGAHHTSRIRSFVLGVVTLAATVLLFYSQIFATEGMMVYYSSYTTALPHPPSYSTSSASGFDGTETKLSMATPGHTTATQTSYWLVRSNPYSQEAILITLDSNGTVYQSQYWNGSSWQLTGGVNNWSIGTGAVGIQQFDFAYFSNDPTHKRGIVVYYRSAIPRVAFKIWYSTSATFDTTDRPTTFSARTYRWIRLEPIPGTNKVICVALNTTGGEQLVSSIFDLDTEVWEAETILDNAIALTGSTDPRCFDLAVDKDGMAMVVWVDTNNVTSLSYSTWTSAGGWAISKMDVGYTISLSTRTQWVRLVPRPGSNEIQLVFNRVPDPGTTRRLHAVIWDGNSWVAGSDISGNTTGSREQRFAVNYERASGRCMIVFSSSTFTPPAYVIRNSGETTWSTPALATDFGADAQGRWYRLVGESNPSSNDLYMMANCANNTIKWQKWNGSAWGSVTTIETNSLSLRRSFDFCFLNTPSPSLAPPSWVSTEIIVTTDSIKWVLKNEHTSSVDMYVSSAANTGARLAGGELGNILSAATTSWVETGLSPNTLYTRYGESYLVSGSSWSVGLTTCTLAYPPTVVSATSTPGGIMLEWNNSGAAAYRIERSTSNFDGYTQTAALILSPGTTHYDSTGLLGGTTYFYKIYVYNQLAVGNDTFTSPVVSTLTYPSSPVGFGKVSVTTTSIVWSWTPPSGFADGYRIYQATSPATLVATVPFGTNTYEETGLSSNTAYGRFVKAYNILGESSASNQATFYTLAAPPTTLTAIPQSYYKINLSWPDSGAYKYVIARSQDDFATPWSTAAVILTPGTTHQDSGLTINTTYWYRIYAINNENTLNTLQFVATSTKTLGGPLSFTPTIDGTKEANWGDVPNAESTAQSAQPGDKLQQLYITDDESYLYLGWSPVIEDPWNDNKSAHYIIFINTGPTSSTVNSDPWQSSTTLGGWSDKPEIAIAGWVNMNTSTNTFGLAPQIYKTDSDVWGAPIGSIDQYSSSAVNNWNELRISRSILGVLKDQQIEVLLVYRPAEDKPGITDAIPYDFSANDWGDVSSNLSSRRYYTLQSLGNQAPAAPTGLYGVAISTTIIKWEWDITPGATYYNVFRQGDNALLANLEGNGTTTWFETALSSNTQYARYVKAGNSYGISDPSASASRYTLAYPPESLTATAVSSSTINLSWNFSGATKYQVWRSTVSINDQWYLISTIASPSLTYSDTNLIAGVTHYYGIMPVNGDDVAYQNFTSPIVSTRTWPSPVVSLSSSAATTTSITWTWSAALGADSYAILMATSPSTIIGQTGSGQTTFTETNLSTNTSYGRYVRAYNTSGAGVISPSATFYTLAAQPNNLQVDEVTTNSVSLSWSANTNPSGTRYGLGRSTDNFTTDITTIVAYGDALTSTNYNATGLSQNTTYYFRVWAYNGDVVATSYTSSVSSKTLRNVIIDNESFEGTFPPDGWWTNDASTGAIQSTTYKRTGSYSVQFNNGADVLRTPLLDAPGLFTFWLYASAGATDFKVEYSTSVNGSWTALPGTPITADLGGVFQQQSFDLSGLNNIYIRFYRGGSKTYYLDDVNVAAFSPDNTPPSPISNLTALAGSTDGELRLKWSAPSGDDGSSTPLTGGYIIKYSSVQIINSSDFNSPSFAHGAVVISTSGVAVGQEVTYIFTNLNPGTSYWFAIKSTDTAGNLSVWKSSSDVSTINTAAYGSAQDLPPSTPTNLTATANENMIQLTWDPVSVPDLSHYELECDSTSATLWDDSFIATNTLNTSYLHTGLENNVTYYYRVRAVDTPPNVLPSGWSTVVSTYPRPSPPLAPSLSYDLSATTTDSIKWVLTDNSGNEQNLYISSAANTGARLWTSIGLAGTGGTTSWLEAGFTPNQAVTRYAEASNNIGSSWSGAKIVYTKARPPINFAFTGVFRTSVTVVWENNGNPNYTRYEISCSTDSFVQNFSTPISLSDNCTGGVADIFNLASGTNYQFRLRAFNEDGVPTNFVSISTKTNSLGNLLINEFFESWDNPNKPSNWTYSGTATNITQSTIALNSGGSYSVKWAPTSSANNFISSPTVSIASGGTYYAEIWVYLLNEVSINTVKVALDIANPEDGTFPTASYITLTNVDVGQWIKITKSRFINAGNFGGIRVRAYYDTGGSGSKFLIGAAWLSDTPPPSGWPPVTPPDTTPPGAITNLSAIADTNVEGKITLTWTAPGDDIYSGNNSGGYYLIKYATYSVSGSSLTWWNSISTSVAPTINKGWKVKTSPSTVGTTESEIFTGLYPSVTYYFAVTTVDDMANWSELDVQIGSNDPAVQAQAAVTNLPPSKPAGVTATSSNTVVILNWNANTEPDLKEYRVSSNTVDSFATSSLVVATANTSFNVSGLKNGVTYYFWVQAVDNTDYVSSTSTVVSAMPIIRPPSALSSNHRGTYVDLNWANSPDSGASNFAGYVVYRSSISATIGFNIVAVLTGGTTHQDTNNVETTTIYYYMLRSSDTAGPLSYATSVSQAIPDSEPPVITLNAPSLSPLIIEVRGSEIVFEATVADSQNTAYIAGISTPTVKINFVVSGSTIAVNFDEISEIVNVTSSSRILSAKFKTSLYASKSGLNTSLKNILESGGTFYYYLEARDGVGNVAVSDVSVRKVIVKEEPKTSSVISSASGGTVSLTDGNPADGETSVQIPQGALTSDVTITIKQEDPASPTTTVPRATNENSIKTDVNDKKPITVYEFGPTGTVFKKPATITLLYFESGGAIKDIAGNAITAVTEDDLKIYTYDGVKWIYVGGTIDKDKNTVSAKVSHFTLYALFASKGAPEKPTASVKFITPNGDGINDFLNFEGSASDFKEITIYDINGKLIRKIYDTNIWDATDDSGKPVEIGAYIWRAVYQDGKSNYGTVVVAR